MKQRPFSSLTALMTFALLAMVGPALAATNTFSVVNSGFSAYVISGVSNGDLRLVRGFTYTLNVNAAGHPFWINAVRGTGTGNAYSDGVTGNGTSVGVIQFAVPTNAPSLLYYNCQFHAGMTGDIIIEDPPHVQITAISVSTNLVLTSTGTDALNVAVDSRTSLTSGTWTPVPILSNVHSSGSNITHVDLPFTDMGFVRVRQGF